MMNLHRRFIPIAARRLAYAGLTFLASSAMSQTSPAIEASSADSKLRQMETLDAGIRPYVLLTNLIKTKVTIANGPTVRAVFDQKNKFADRPLRIRAV